MALADFAKALATEDDMGVRSAFAALITADNIVHASMNGGSPMAGHYWNAERVHRFGTMLQTYFGPAFLGTFVADEPQPQGQQGSGDGNISEGAGTGNAAGAETQADLGGAGAGGGPAPATAQQGLVSTIEVEAARVAHKALDIGEEGIQAIEEALGRKPADPAPAPPPASAPRIA